MGGAKGADGEGEREGGFWEVWRPLSNRERRLGGKRVEGGVAGKDGAIHKE